MRVSKHKSIEELRNASKSPRVPRPAYVQYALPVRPSASTARAKYRRLLWTVPARFLWINGKRMGSVGLPPVGCHSVSLNSPELGRGTMGKRPWKEAAKEVLSTALRSRLEKGTSNKRVSRTDQEFCGCRDGRIYDQPPKFKPVPANFPTFNLTTSSQAATVGLPPLKWSSLKYGF